MTASSAVFSSNNKCTSLFKCIAVKNLKEEKEITIESNTFQRVIFIVIHITLTIALEISEQNAGHGSQLFSPGK